MAFFYERRRYLVRHSEMGRKCTSASSSILFCYNGAHLAWVITQRDYFLSALYSRCIEQRVALAYVYYFCDINLTHNVRSCLNLLILYGPWRSLSRAITASYKMAAPIRTRVSLLSLEG